MDFEKVLGSLTSEFKTGKAPYALIGGFAMGIWGVVRATHDLDFLIDKKEAAHLKSTMVKLKYDVVFESENTIQFRSKDDAWGSLDFIYAFRQPAMEMLTRAVTKHVFGDKIKIQALIPEDLIGLKLQALVNNPSHKFHDMEDIKNLITVYGDKIDWGIVQGHFALFKEDGLFNKLKEDYGKNKAV